MSLHSPMPKLGDLLPGVPQAEQPASSMPQCLARDIRHCAFCSVLKGEELRHLRAIARQVRLAPKQVLFHEGDAADNVFNLLSGVIKLYKLLPDGRRQITSFANGGNFLGISSAGAYSYTAQAVTEATLCRFPRRQLLQLFYRYPRLEGRLLAIATDELTAAQDQMLLLGRKTAAEKVASFLISLADRVNGDAGISRPVSVPMTRGDVADYLGLTNVTVSRILSKFRDEGLIHLPDANNISIRRPDDLMDIAEGF